MHPRIDQLLRLRDGEPVDAATREHVDHCVACSASLRRIALRRRSLQELPLLDAPDIDYARIRARASGSTQTLPVTGGHPSISPLTGGTGSSGHPSFSSSTGHPWKFAAAAAAVLAVIAGALVIGRSDNPPPSQADVSPTKVAVPDFLREHQRQESPVAHLVAQSRELDQLLQRLPRPEVQRVSLADTVDRIEQRVQWLDMQISSVPDTAANDLLAQALWSERVELMDSLVTVRYAESFPRQFFTDKPAG